MGLVPPLAGGPGAWIEVRSPHFIAYSEASEADTRRTLEGFEGIRSVFTAILPGLKLDLHKPLVVIVAEGQATMRQFAPEPFEGKDPTRPAGLYRRGPDRDLAILRLDVPHQTDQPYAVVFHEYTHGIIHNNFARLPTWLDEGIADFYGSTEIRSKRVYLGRIPRHHILTLRQNRMPLEDLLRVTHDSPAYREGTKANLFYAQSWALVHYLFMETEARRAGTFRTYIQALATEPDPLSAARKGLGDLKTFEEQLARYAARPAFTFLDLPLKVALEDRDFQVRPVSEAEALALRAEVLGQSSHEEEATRLLERARALDPRLPQVQAGLAFAALRKSDGPAAALALKTARELGSRDFRVPLRLAELALQGQVAPQPAREELLGWIEEARQMEPQQPGVHMALCRAYAKDPVDPDKAVQAGRTALQLAPSDFVWRLNFGNILMGLGREREAREMGEEMARMAEEGWERQAAANYQAQLTRFLEYRAAQAAALPAPGAPQGGPGAPMGVPQARSGAKAPKFWLPDSLAALGNEVRMALLEGRTEDALQRVKAEIPKARTSQEKTSLKALLQLLQAMQKGYVPPR